jgi:hypothetical protein
MNIESGSGNTKDQILEGTQTPRQTYKNHINEHDENAQTENIHSTQNKTSHSTSNRTALPNNSSTTTTQENSMTTQDNPTPPEEFTQNTTAIETNKTGRNGQQSPNSQSNNTRRPLLQQILQQYDSSPSKKNKSWGACINKLPPTTFHIYFQNTYELQYKSHQTKLQPHLDFMKEKDIAISGFAKTNTNWHFKQIKKQITATCQETVPFHSVAFSDNHFNPPDRSSYLLGNWLLVIG